MNKLVTGPSGKIVIVSDHVLHGYCAILKTLGMEEVGDPVLEVERLKALADAGSASQQPITHPAERIGHPKHECEDCKWAQRQGESRCDGCVSDAEGSPLVQAGSFGVELSKQIASVQQADRDMECHRKHHCADELLEALKELLRPYGVADVGMAYAPGPLQMEFIAAVRLAKDAIAKATGA